MFNFRFCFNPVQKIKRPASSVKGNRILKNYVVQSAGHIGIFGPDDLKSDYKRRDAQGQHADFGMSRRFLRMAISMMKTSQTYLPKSLRVNTAKMGDRTGYYLSTWPKLTEKWYRAQALDIAFDKGMPYCSANTCSSNLLILST